MNKRLGILLAATLCALLCPGALLGQGSDGTILGTVKDSTNAVVPDVAVTIRNTDTNVERKVTTDHAGYFNVSALPAGPYQVKAEHAGFKTVAEDGLVLTVSQQMTINLMLPVGTANQVVEVSTEASTVNTVDNSIGGLVTEQAIQDLPLNGRNYVDLVLMEPGTNQDYAVGGSGGAGASTFSNHGSTPWSNLFTLDGAILNNALQLNSSSQTGNTLGLDGIQEFKIVGIPDASYGLVMGGQIVMATRVEQINSTEASLNTSATASSMLEITLISLSCLHRISALRISRAINLEPRLAVQSEKIRPSSLAYMKAFALRRAEPRRASRSSTTFRPLAATDQRAP